MEPMRSRDPLRGPRALVTHATSYVARRPIALGAGLDTLSRPAAVALAPLVAGWSIARAATGALDALRIGMQARRAPLLREDTGLLAPLDGLAPVCTLVSDAHVTTARRVPSELVYDPEQWPDDDRPVGGVIASGLARVLEHVAAHAPELVVWCGDEVDTGDRGDWKAWRAVVDGVPGLAHRLVPGNHDVCFNPELDEDHTLARRAMRERAFRAHGGALADFPVVDTVITDAGPVTLLLLDSCRHTSTHVLSNAVGRFGDEQLDELTRVLGHLQGPLLCVTHHHVWRDAGFVSHPDEWFNVAIDAERLGHVLARYSQRAPINQVLVCHGHRHVLHTGRIAERVAVLGMPSTTLGDKGGGGVLDGVLRYAVPGLRADGGWGVAIIAVGPLRE